MFSPSRREQEDGAPGLRIWEDCADIVSGCQVAPEGIETLPQGEGSRPDVEEQYAIDELNNSKGIS